MADRVSFYYRQRVSEQELNLASELLEKADRNFAADLGVFGIVSAAVPTPHQPVPKRQPFEFSRIHRDECPGHIGRL